MKKATLILLLTIPFIVFGQSWKDHKTSWKDSAQEYYWDLDKVEDLTIYNDSNQIVYLKSTMEPLNGKVFVKYADGDLAAKILVVKGKRTGEWKMWHKNGQLSREGSFKNGKEHGLTREWYENGELGRQLYYYYGEIKEEKCWDEDGVKIDCDNY